ncbi:MAG: twin-arginine translocation signal domain-containing protein, partial [Verrucomicrobiae bacterium]|nr:twin-arginine translocation signal domain-containing protein [Verrucomicrobiae bacterium]
MATVNLHRREFLKRCGLAAAGAILSAPGVSPGAEPAPPSPKLIRIKSVDSNFEREPLVRPFGFKGGYVTEIWQTAALLESDSGLRKIGLCTQSPLWSDAEVFAAHTESGGNALMYALTERALQMIKGQSFTSPIQLLEGIFEELYRHGQKITNNPKLRKTFVLNSLVGVDNAAWLLYAAENGLKNFDAMIPSAYRPALSHRHSLLACIPLITYGVPIDEIKAAAEQGFFFMKIKIGQPGTQEEMLAKDILRISAIHNAIGAIRTPHTKDGRLPYYFDANGRYEKKETLLRLLDHARKIGAFDQIAIVEEPFPEEMEI